jgi:phosphatidylglycerol:prolipoprotein diacylglycerol transferase
MWPSLFGVPAHPVFLVLAIATGTATAVRCARSTGLTRDQLGGLWLVLVGAGVAGLLGAKLDSLLERGGAQPLVWELRHGYRYPGGMLAALLALLILAAFAGAGRWLGAIGDAVAPAAAVAMVVVRIGCFLAGCCHGTGSDLPWAVAFPAGSLAWTAQASQRLIRGDAPAALPVHPLQLYFALWSVGLGVFLLWLLPRRTYAGQVLLVYVALDNLMKGSLESLREPAVPHLQWMSLVIGAGAAGLLGVAWVRGWGRAARFTLPRPPAATARRPPGS